MRNGDDLVIKTGEHMSTSTTHFVSRRLRSITNVAQVVGLATFVFLASCLSASAQEISGLQAAAALEDVLVRAIERSEKSVVSIARFQREPGEVAGNPFQPEFIPRP